MMNIVRTIENKMFINGLLLVLFYVSESLERNTSPFMLTPELVEIEGYQCDTHIVTTNDGYLLTNYRIPNYKSEKSPVILLHGLVTSSKDYMLKRNKSLAILLHNEGYDVWLLNLRFTEETKHLSLSRHDHKFWDFGLEEHSAFDVAESIDYILEITKSKKVIYIGLSAGNIMYMMLCNLRPDLVDKIEYQISLAPIWYITKSQTEMQESLAPDFLKTLASVGLNHFVYSDDLRRLTLEICREKSRLNLCFLTTFSMFGADWDNVDWDNMHMVNGRYVAFTFKQLDHMLQNGRSGLGFSRYDYGSAENMKRYGSKKPPVFDAKACTAPRIVYFGKNDKVAPLQDAKKFLNTVRGPRNKVYLRYPKSKFFNHFDFFTGTNETDAFYKNVISLMNKM